MLIWTCLFHCNLKNSQKSIRKYMQWVWSFQFLVRCEGSRSLPWAVNVLNFPFVIHKLFPYLHINHPMILNIFINVRVECFKPVSIECSWLTIAIIHELFLFFYKSIYLSKLYNRNKSKVIMDYVSLMK